MKYVGNIQIASVSQNSKHGIYFLTKVFWNILFLIMKTFWRGISTDASSFEVCYFDILTYSFSLQKKMFYCQISII